MAGDLLVGMLYNLLLPLVLLTGEWTSVKIIVLRHVTRIERTFLSVSPSRVHIMFQYTNGNSAAVSRQS